MKITRFIILLFVIKAAAVRAQDKSTLSRAISDTTEQTALALQGFSYFHPENKSQVITESDTSIQHEFTRFDPTKRRGQEHVTLGNTFSAANPLLFQPLMNLRFDVGYHSHDIYQYQFANARFYTAKKAQSEIFFSQFSNQLNFSADAKIAIPFQSGWSFSLDYMRVSEKGFYPSQAVKSTNLSTGLHYQSKASRYQLFVGFHHHAQDEENNGGIRDPEQVIGDVPRPAVSTYINGAKFRQQKRGYSLVQYLTLAGNDSWKLFVRNTLLYEPSYYKFSQATTSKDTVYYGSLLTDSRGIRRYVDQGHYLIDMALHGENQKKLSGQLGIRYDQYSVHDQGFNLNRNDITLYGKGNVPIFNIFSLKTAAELGLGQNAGNFMAEGSLEIRLKKWALVDGGMRIFVSEPSYAQQHLVLNQNRVFDRDFAKSFGTRIFGKLDIPASGTSIQFAQSILTNPVYWKKVSESDGQIAIASFQSDKVLSYTLLGIKQNLKIYTFEFNHAVYFQLFSENIFHLPPWYSSHQLYWNVAIFKKAMLLSIGGEARLIPTYAGIGYSPVHGQFFADDNAELPLVPDVDLVLNAKVKTFRISIMIENAGQWISNQPNYDVKFYPRLDPLLRFSIRWMFYN